MRELRSAWGFLMTAVRWTVWIIETVVLGTRAVRHVARFGLRWTEITGRTVVCPRGHVNAALGVWQCGCGSTFEGWVFDRCPVCRESAGWVPCSTCGLPIQSPIRS